MTRGPRRVPPLRDLIAGGPVLSGRALDAAFAQATGSAAAYVGSPVGTLPILPLQVFGAHYALDLVLVSSHPTWDMHELACLQTPDGPVWLCKDSRAGELVQTIVADLDGLEHVLPEVPLARRRVPVSVRDSGDERAMSLEIAYTNFDGDPVTIAYEGPRPRGPLGKRNSSTMGHSRGDVLAVLDVSHRAFARRASVTIAGRAYAIERVLGLVPMQVALVQTQAGFSRGAWTQTLGGAFTTVHASGARQAWQVDDTDSSVVLTQHHPWRTLRYTFARAGDALELASASVTCFGSDSPALLVRFAPHLPDLRYPLKSPFGGRWFVEMNGQRGWAWGKVGVEASGDLRTVALDPVAPRWTLDRPLRYHFTVGPDLVDAVGTISPNVT